MKLELRVMSDLHMEFENIFLPELPGDDKRVLILAGDIGLSQKRYTYLPFLRDAVDRFRAVVWVFGNHEYYGDSFYRSRNRVKEILEDEGIAGKIHILENNVFVVDDVAILGTTLWTDLDKGNPLAVVTVAGGMNDYVKIRSGSEKDPFRRKFSPAESILQHQASLEWLNDESEAQRNVGRKIVVVTHHLPTYRSIPKELETDRLNVAFASDMEEDMARIGAELWIHGHTHFSSDYVLPSGTRVVCNPRGYAGLAENPEFNPKLIVDVGD